jgi:hypothetical protein
MVNQSTTKLALVGLLYVALLQVAVCQTPGKRTAISAAPVVAALVSAGLGVAASQLQFLSHVDATGQTPTLLVASIESMNAGTAKVKLRCTDNRECIPFYVLVHDVKGPGALAKPFVANSQRPAVDSTRRLVRGGDRATLILETADSRISFPVICLQSGIRGERIRVASADRKRFYRAEVVAPGMLRGNL